MINMPYKEPVVEKVYYSIGEVAEMFNVNASLIRYWEKEFDVLKPHKNKKGNRLFTKSDVENLRLIYHLLKERGLTLKGAKMKLSQNKADVEHNFEVIKHLQSLKQQLLEIKKMLSVSEPLEEEPFL